MSASLNVLCVRFARCVLEINRQRPQALLGAHKSLAHFVSSPKLCCQWSKIQHTRKQHVIAFAVDTFSAETSIAQLQGQVSKTYSKKICRLIHAQEKTAVFEDTSITGSQGSICRLKVSAKK